MIHITISPIPEPNSPNWHPKFNQPRCPLESSAHHHRHKRICRQIRPWSNNQPAASEFIRIAKCPMDLLKNWRYFRQIQRYFVSGVQDPQVLCKAQVSATVVSLFPLFHRRGLVIWPSNVGGCKRNGGRLAKKPETLIQWLLQGTSYNLGFLKSESPKSLTFCWFSILFHDFELEPWVTIFRRAPPHIATPSAPSQLSRPLGPRPYVGSGSWLERCRRWGFHQGESIVSGDSTVDGRMGYNKRPPWNVRFEFKISIWLNFTEIVGIVCTWMIYDDLPGWDPGVVFPSTLKRDKRSET